VGRGLPSVSGVIIDLSLGVRTVIHQLVIVVGWAYALAGIPVGCFALLGRVSPAFALPRQTLVLYWGWFAVVITGSAIATDLL
jgi:hypothetical protein